jgi:hypothetical protein
MEDLLRELEEEAARLSTKSLPPIGFDYRGRTKIERLLFLICKEHCKTTLSYDLGGLSYAHERLLSEETQKRDWREDSTEVVLDAFRLSRQISDLSSSDPYIRERTLADLGGSIVTMFQTLHDEIVSFAATVRRQYRHEKPRT